MRTYLYTLSIRRTNTLRMNALTRIHVPFAELSMFNHRKTTFNIVRKQYRNHKIIIQI